MSVCRLCLYVVFLTQQETSPTSNNREKPQDGFQSEPLSIMGAQGGAHWG